jgi:hypothetical protein
MANILAGQVEHTQLSARFRNRFDASINLRMCFGVARQALQFRERVGEVKAMRVDDIDDDLLGDRSQAIRAAHCPAICTNFRDGQFRSK